MTKKVVTVTSTIAAFATAEYRLYSGSETTISTSFGTITQIEFTKNGNYSLGNLSTETGTYTSSTGIWEGDASSVTFNASAQVRLNQIAVTVTAPSSAVATTTTINVPANFNTDVYTNTTAGTLTATVKDNENNTISGATVTWSSSNTDVATIDATGAVTLVAVGTTTITASYAGVEDEYRPSEGTYELTVTSTAPASTYTLANSIVSGKTYIIVGFNGDVAYAMGAQNNNNRAGVAISVDGTTATGNADVHEVVITALDGDDAGKYTIYDGGYLYAASSSNNYLKTEAQLDDNDNGIWAISIDQNGVASIVAQGNNTRNLMRFNPNTNNGNPIFACYASNSTIGSLPKLYVKEETFPLDIDQYTSNENGWYLIASPVAVDLTNHPMVQGDYDLYRFNPTADLEWENYKNTDGHTDFTALEVGRGYLYANGNEGGIELNFSGVPSNNGEVTMPYEGWNLVGNPLSTAATITNEYYRMNDTHTGIMAEAGTGNIGVMEGVFVQATEANQTVTFTPAENGNTNGKSAIKMNLSQNRGGVIDRAIVRFGNSNTLPKFQLFENSTKIYFAQNGEEYAILGAEPQGEMPVSFKASKNGSYTLTVNPTEVEMNYLHLIDNMTGADVDLLANPSYTFNAKADDYTSRFRLVFSANNVEEMTDENETFAFINNGNLIVNGTGTLQVFDALGRQILTKELSTANCQLSTANFNTGVYVLRLVNGNDVKTQKIIVK